PVRRSILDTKGLSAELRAREQACRSIDHALATATAGRIELRPHRADAMAAMLLPWLRTTSMRSSLLVRRLSSLRDDDPTRMARWQWTTMRASTQGLVIRGVAWDADGRAMAATSRGLAFWNGATWTEISPEKARGASPSLQLPDPTGIRFVQRVGTG